MATLVLGTIGRAVGGRLGGLVGTIAGSVLDRGLLGGGKAREGARPGDLAVQSSAYGEAIPRHYGRMRAAGNLVWSAGIRETRQRTGGGKRGTATNSYSYSASFAVILAGRPITAIGRVWADGKLLRAADGGLIFPAIIRVYPGSEDQPVDPLIAAAEGLGSAPAYRGRAYAVFEDLALADFGNRIPNLTFEIVADAGDSIGTGIVIRDIAAAAGVALTVAGTDTPVHGFASLGDSARAALTQVDAITVLSLADDGTALHLHSGVPAARIAIPRDDLGATASGHAPSRNDVRAAGGSVPDALGIAFSDPARDYQSGVQRAIRRTPSMRTEQRTLDAALDAAAAKQLAATLLRRAAAARTSGTMTLPWRHAGLRPGDIIVAGDDPDPWRIRTRTILGAVVELGVERVASGTGALVAADPGRPADPGDRPQGPTLLHVLDLPPLPGPLPSTPRLWLAAAGTGRWSRADVVVSLDGGGAYTLAATIDAPAIIGTAATALPPGCTDRWDRLSTVEVTLLDPDMWLESQSEAAVLAGANLALAGDEIIQFANVVAVSSGRFRLSTLLRGRRGTEAASGVHRAGERFVMLDAGLAAFDPSPEAIGAAMIFKAAGPGDDVAAMPPVPLRLEGRALRPLPPVFVRAKRESGAIDVSWVRRSRAGFGWTDGADAAIAEESEAYNLTVSVDGRAVRAVTLNVPWWHYDAAAQAADGAAAGIAVEFVIAQISAAAGLGGMAALTLTL